MARRMLDTIGPEAAQLDVADMYAGYVDGAYAWSAADFAQHPRAAHVRITVLPGPAGFGDYQAASIVDVERGALTPYQARQFVAARNEFRPGPATVYCNLSTLPAVRSACRGLTWRLWLAWYVPVQPSAAQAASAIASVGGLPAGVELVAVQWRNEPGFDESVVFDPEWHPQP
jgi:hypothetical protein